MVSLSIGNEEEVGIDIDSLRDCAFWYPEVPGPELYLHERFFMPRQSAMKTLRPLWCVLFGGPKGSYLSHLTSISVFFKDHTGVCGIRFNYDTNSIPKACRFVGRNDFVKHRLDTLNFVIDGPAGESITVITPFVRISRSTIVGLDHESGSLQGIKASDSSFWFSILTLS